MDKKVLILGVAAVQLDAILQLKAMGMEVHAIAQSKDGPGADAADRFEAINFMDTDAVIDYIREQGIRLVYSVGSDMAMPQACMISDRLSLPKFVDEQTARICNNKDRMRESLGKDFEGNVGYQVVEDSEEALDLAFPFIVKPSDSQGQRGITIVNKQEEYLEAFAHAKQYSRSGKVILEQYIQGPEISVNGYMVDGKIRFMFATDRVCWDDHFGLIHKHVLPCASLTDRSSALLASIMEKACKKLKIENGPVYAQVKVEDDRPYIIEITPRLDGCHMWKLLDRHTGINLLKLTFEHLLNGDVSELDKPMKLLRPMTLEFICQEPGTLADYRDFEKELDALPSFCYYRQGDRIRPVNGKYEKIGYFIDEE